MPNTPDIFVQRITDDIPNILVYLSRRNVLSIAVIFSQHIPSMTPHFVVARMVNAAEGLLGFDMVDASTMPRSEAQIRSQISVIEQAVLHEILRTDFDIEYPDKTPVPISGDKNPAVKDKVKQTAAKMNLQFVMDQYRDLLNALSDSPQH